MNIEVLMAVSDEVVAEAAERFAKQHDVDYDDVTFRGLSARAVMDWLPIITTVFSEMELFAKHRRGMRRPRRIDSEIWEYLNEAAYVVDIPQIALLRCAIGLQAKFGSNPGEFLTGLTERIYNRSMVIRERAAGIVADPEATYREKPKKRGKPSRRIAKTKKKCDFSKIFDEAEAR